MNSKSAVEKTLMHISPLHRYHAIDSERPCRAEQLDGFETHGRGFVLRAT